MLYKCIIAAILAALITFSFIGYRYFSSPTSFEVGKSIRFQTKGGEFKYTVISSKGRDYEMMERVFEEYIVEHNASNLKIYRTTSKNYFLIKNWHEYKTKPEWQHEFLPVWKR